MSDLAVRCEHLSEMETPLSAEALRLPLVEVQRKTEELRDAASMRYDQLREALWESERRQGQLDNYRQSVDNLQQWIDDTRLDMEQGGSTLDTIHEPLVRSTARMYGRYSTCNISQYLFYKKAHKRCRIAHL